MNVLIVPSWYKSEINPVLGSFFREQALALSKQGHNVYVADATLQSLRNLFCRRMFRLCRYDDEGLNTYSRISPAFGLGRTASGGLGIYFRNLKRIYKALVADGVEVDVIHAHSFFPAGIAAVRLGKEYGIPVVVTEHNSLVLTGKLQKGRLELLKETVDSSTEFVCVSGALRDSVLRLTDTKKDIKVIPNLLDARFVYKAKNGMASFTYVSIGNLIQSKRFDLTLKAFAKVAESIENIRLVIVGDGVLKNDLRSLATKLGVGDKVDFKGRLPKDKVLEELYKSNVFVLPSDFETFGVVYIEALASGTPVIATRNGGAECIVTEDNGILTDVGSEEQLIDAMLSLYKEYDRYNKESISKNCIALYGEESVGNEISALYKRIISSL